MRKHSVVLAAVLAAAIAAGAHHHATAPDPHQHGAAAPAKLTLDQGKKWATDEALRKNMADIRSALAAKQESVHKGTLAGADYKALGATIEAKVATIVADCKLPPAGDANLHLIVAELIAGTDAMQGKSATKPSAGAIKVVQAANRYGQYFDDPGWQPLR